jgi:hypothetical protein
MTFMKHVMRILAALERAVGVGLVLKAKAVADEAKEEDASSPGDQ